jgi:ABC-type sugar transport system, periplasmic component
MGKKFSKYGICIFTVVCLLVLSAGYKVYLVSAKNNRTDVKDPMKNKRVVTVWMENNYDTETRKLQVDIFNRNNKDNIYIDFQTYGSDYSNLLRTSLATQKKPDIFQYSYYDVIKNKNILNLEDTGINLNNIDKNDFLYFNKKPVGVKISGNSVKFAWNKDLLKGAGIDPDTVPQTWDDVIEIANRIKKAYPDITPFEFPAFTMEDIKNSIGETSVNLGSIYTTFWDYKKGAYNFQYSKDILTVYNKMYGSGLISNEFSEKSKEDVRKDFYEKKCAMIISTYEDKRYFTNVLHLSFNIGVNDLPKINKTDTGNYYFDQNSNSMVINKDIKDVDAVAKVYEWIISDNVNNELFASGNTLPTILNTTDLYEEGKYSNYSSIKNFKNEIYDPTPFISYNSNETIKLFSEAIKGLKPIDTVIDKLNKNFASYKQSMIDKDSFDFSLFVD